MAELPFQAEYAKTGRASCKGCKEKIDQGSLRIAVMVQSAFYDGKQPNWHHEECFFKKQRALGITDIANFNTLKSADKKRIQKKLEKYTGVVMPIEEPKGKGKGKKRAADAPDLALNDFRVEYSKSSRASCRHCDIKIVKDEVRICKVVFDTEIGYKYGGQPLWHHIKCFAEKRHELLYFAGGENLPGFTKLNEADQETVKEEIKALKIDEVPIKKLKDEPKDAAELKEEKAKQKKMEKQNQLFQKYRLVLSELTKKDLTAFLEANSQEVLSGRDKCIDHLADCMAFGALEPCPDCKQGQLILDTFGYKCKGHASDWAKCSYTTQNPSRVRMKVPKAVLDNSNFNKYKPKTDIRLFDAAPPPVVFIKNEPASSAIVKKELPTPPLKNLQFFLYGWLGDKEGTKRRILKLGGLVVNHLTKTTAAVVSTKRDVEKMPTKMMEVKDIDVEVVEESFLDAIDPTSTSISNTLQLIKEHNIADWGSDPATRIPQDVLDGKSIPKSGSQYVASSSKSVKLQLKGGSAVDPDSGVAHEAHVYSDEDGVKYTAVLSRTDVVTQKNSYYKLQVLKHDNRKKYWLFRSWGRIGTTIGGKSLEQFRNVEEAIFKFEELYLKQTENPWQCRDTFMKVPGGYYPVEMDYEDQKAPAKLEMDAQSDLPASVQWLVTMIFDIAAMKTTLREFQLDTEKMPLGKLSKKQITDGYKVLSEIQDLINSGNATENKIIDATNRFFTFIPHDFGVNNAPLLNQSDLITSKIQMLDNLLEIEIAYSLMKTESTDESPIDASYRKLRAQIAPLAACDEYDLIAKYLRNTHADTHSQYTLDIEQVFKVVREGEDKRYKPFRKLHNRRLLWHGSRVTNYAGILSQGLRIAPPEAPVTGYMFGKGIYFADMVSKSANYCCTSPARPVGLLLLCEVALGNMKECPRAEDVKLKAGQHSAWGVGRTQPDPAAAAALPDGTLVPLGAPVAVGAKTSLLYNEFIVYDVAQVNVKYLLQVKFNFK